MTLQLPDFSAILKGYLNHPSLVSEVDEEAIGRAVTRQLTVTDSGPALRLSGLGKCRKALAYAHHGTPPNGREIDARARTVFALGDMTEAFLVTALDQALEQQADDLGWILDYVGDNQQTVELEVYLPTLDKTLSIPGHPDGTLRHPDIEDRIVLEVKSTSSYGFSRWQKALKEGEDPWGPEESYYWQLQAYMHAMGAEHAYVLALCKDSGATCGWHVEKDDDYMRWLVTHLEAALGPDNPRFAERRLPDGSWLRPVEKLSKRDGVTPLKGHGQLPWQCRYCSHYKSCYGNNLEERVEKDYRGAPSLGLCVKS